MTRFNSFSTLKSHLDFASAEIENHLWTAEINAQMRKDLDVIRRRLDDGCANISVVGEFSAGKSSFINALLGIELLETDEMPDTTLVPTVLFYSPEPSFQIVRNSGEEPVKRMSLSEVKKNLRKFCVPELNPEDFRNSEEFTETLMKQREEAARIAAGIVLFKIGIPSEFLKQGFRLIDTPGVNSGNMECSEIAKRVMMQTDTSIIVADSCRGVITESLRSLFSGFLGEKLKHCMVVFTRFDLTTPARRPKLKLYLEASTRSYFNLNADQMPVLMAVPPTVTANRQGLRFGREHDEMYLMTRQSLDTIAGVAIERKESIITDGLRSLFNRIYCNLESHVRNMQVHCNDNLRELEESRSVPLNPFIEKQKGIGEINLKTHKLEIRKCLETALENDITELRNLCEIEVFQKQITTRNLRDFLKSGLPIFIMKHVDVFSKKVTNALDEFNEKIEDQYKEFESDLNREFKKLTIIPVKFERSEINPISIKDELEQSLKDISSLASYQVKQDNKEIAGAVIGGIIGSVFTFGIGSAIGALVGAAIASDGEKNGIQGAREKVRPVYEEKMGKILPMVKDRLLNIYDKVSSDTVNIFFQNLNEYNCRYRDLIDNMIAEEKKQQESYKRLMVSLEMELEEINKHKSEIELLCKTN